jgi:hypothetical protein
MGEEGFGGSLMLWHNSVFNGSSLELKDSWNRNKHCSIFATPTHY